LAHSGVDAAPAVQERADDALHEQLVSGDDEGAWVLQPRENGGETRPSLNNGNDDNNNNEIHVRMVRL